jgi:hypothetical protein
MESKAEARACLCTNSQKAEITGSAEEAKLLMQ